ncbi:MAG: RimK family alpha-L-glutamate ligase [bacterium]|nr:RimK family alpha-L-glutamate ligase [bacterium]
MNKKKLTGYLVVNHFLNANKYNELYEYFLEAAAGFDVDLILKTNAELIVDEDALYREVNNIDFVLFWDKDVRLACLMEEIGYRLFNSARAIEVCDDKSLTYLELKKANVHMPKTIIGPKTFEHVDYTNTNFTDCVVKALGLPLVVKECFGSFGMQVYLVNTKEELEQKLMETSPKPLIFQQLIKESAGRDVRLQVIGDQVVASMYRYSDSDDFRANLSIGGKMKPFVPTKEQEEIAIRCCKAIGLDFAGVDLLFGEDHQTFVCEVNSNAHFKNIYDCTKVNAATLIIRHIVDTLQKEK